MNQAVKGMVGLARRAGKAVSGEFGVVQAIRQRKARIVIVAADASANTRDFYRQLCQTYSTELFFHGSKAAWGAALGKGIRAAVAIVDDGFAGRIKELLQNIGSEGESSVKRE